MVAFKFNANEHQLPSSGMLLPAANYDVEIVAAEINAKAGSTDKGLKLKLRVLSGQYHGATIQVNLSLWYANETAARIAAQELSGYAHATGVDQFSDVSALFYKPFKIYLSQQTYEKRNAVGVKTGETSVSNQVETIFYADGSELVKGQFGVAKNAPVGNGPAASPAAPAAPAPQQAAPQQAAPQVAPQQPAPQQAAPQVAPAAPAAPTAPAAGAPAWAAPTPQA